MIFDTFLGLTTIIMKLSQMNCQGTVRCLLLIPRSELKRFLKDFHLLLNFLDEDWDRFQRIMLMLSLFLAVNTVKSLPTVEAIMRRADIVHIL